MIATWSAIAATVAVFCSGVVIHLTVVATRAARSRRRLSGHEGRTAIFTPPALALVGPVHFRWVALGLPAVIVLISTGPLLALVTLTVGLIGHRLVRTWLADRRRQAYEASLPEFLDNLNRSLYSGAGLLVAFTDASQRATGQLAIDVNAVLHRCSVGTGLPEALAGWQAGHRSASVRLCVGAITLAMETGGSPARAIDSASATVRQTLVAKEVARTHATEARASAMALTVLPLVVSGPVLLTNVDARQFLFHSVVGQACLTVGLALSAMGAYCMSYMVKKVLP